MVVVSFSMVEKEGRRRKFYTCNKTLFSEVYVGCSSKRESMHVGYSGEKHVYMHEVEEKVTYL
jgi:hypothetical protein